MASQKSSLPIHVKQTSPRKVSLDLDPYAAPAEYYGKSHAPRKVAKSRTYSAHDPTLNSIGGYTDRKRRSSHDAHGNTPRQFQINVEDTLQTLLAREDTDHNIQITIEDHGPKVFALGTAASAGYKRFDIRGNYMLSNLLQELSLAKKHGRKQIILDEARLNENPVNKLSRRIYETFWPNLTRRIDSSNVAVVGRDLKDWTADPRPRIYVPHGVPEQYEYYKRISEEKPELRLEVVMLPEDPSNPEYVRDLNEAPGLLAIEMERIEDTKEGKPDYRGLPFVVPGGRFNELYGWDSYMETLGLLIHNRVDLCESMVRHFCFSIQHYGKILNANRTYYLCRSQPPFLTDMALRTYERMEHSPESLEFLRKATLAAIKDYYTTWMSPPRLDPESGLSRYYAGGIGVPPETESTHFVHVLQPYAEERNMTIQDFTRQYNYGQLFVPELDEYFVHDRSIRESGHDTSYRLENVCADLATVDLNSLLYKYEVDIARTIRERFGDQLEIPPEWQVKGKASVESSGAWDRRARKRRKAMGKLMWDDETGMFFDYDTVKHKQTGYESATTFWAMWAGVATPEQAAIMVKKALPLFEEHGGLASGTEKSRGGISLNRPNRQWDYPYGWAPQQILAWTGFERYGYMDEAKRLAYRWLYMVTRAFVDFNGIVVEKYDVTKRSGGHKVTAEYGNQGSKFEGVATEGFGWVNASYVYGLNIIDARMRRALGAVTDWDTFQRMTERADSVETAIYAHEEAHKEGEGPVVFHPMHRQGLPHSVEDSVAHKAIHGEGVVEHKGPRHS